MNVARRTGVALAAGLVVAACVASVPARAGTAAPDPARARVELGPQAHRSAYVSPRPPRRIARLAAGLGAALAWDLADPPRHQARLPEPVGGFTAGAAFKGGALAVSRTDGSRAAIDVLFDRWNTLYPPYALEGTNDH